MLWLRAPRMSFAARIREQRYRRHFLRADAGLSVGVMAFTTLATVSTIRNDLLLYRGTYVFTSLIGVRVVGLALGIGAIWRLHRATKVRQYDVAFAVWVLALSVMMGIICVTRVPFGEIQGPLVALCSAVMIYGFALRGPLWPRVAGTLLVGAGTMPIVWGSETNVTAIGRTTITAGVLLWCVVGFLSARFFEEQRRKRFDAELLEKQARRLLQQKMVELAEEKKRVESLARARTAFLAAMSHEFRTPMNAVLGFSELLLALRLDNKAHEYANSIRDSARGLLGLLNDVLDFAKIDADKLQLATVSFDLRGLVNSVIAMMEPIAATRPITVELQVDHGVPDFVVGDDMRLRQVLVNLVSNGIKFTERGTVRLRITAVPTATDKQHLVTFAVEDSGIGMPPDVVSRLFQPFEQGDQGMTRRHQGTGLGLAISKRIVQAMGGDIVVESEQGRGSKFSFSIELTETAPTTPATGRGVKDVRATFAILVVDDNAINRRVASAMLERMGYSADLVDGGTNALLAVTQKDYDIVFMDLHMPDMNGIETTHAIHKKLAGRKVPRIVAMTASVFEEDREACRQAGMQDFVAKPIDLAQLDKVLGRIAKQRSRTSVAPGVPTELDREALQNLWDLESAAEPGFVANILRDFLDDSPRRIERMRAAFEAKHAQEVRFEAHALKSACKSLGATEMSTLCARIETAARAEDFSKLPEWIDALTAEFARVEPLIAAEIVKPRARLASSPDSSKMKSRA